jgi:hypothetical protein
MYDIPKSPSGHLLDALLKRSLDRYDDDQRKLDIKLLEFSEIYSELGVLLTPTDYQFIQ